MLRWLKKRITKTTSAPSRSEDIREDERWIHLEEILSFPVSDPTYYERALRHRSIIDGEQYEKHETYERLEFLGDAVLDLIITELIFDQFPEEDEGFMTKLRAKLVRGDTLAKLASSLELYEILEVGQRAQGQGIELSKSVLADVFEALIAAIYLTEGYSKAYSFVDKVLEFHLDIDRISVTVDNYKSVLLEYTQAEKMPLPKYRVISESGPGHDKTFDVAVSIGGDDYGTGRGKNKKQAEQLAARQALQYLKSDQPDTD